MSENWITLGATTIPLFGIAGSAVAYVIKLFQDKAVRRRERFFELMQFIDGKGTIAAKVAAVYSLREFSEHREFIVRFCEAQMDNIEGAGSAADSLRQEMQFTADAMRK
ncbi:hypothetical protein ABIE62_001601 [Porphyrobacter sp. MBR-155]|uniref:hypothetical protein n=1 Tax=Porphyrobacter sp. MBR-155 TaxID=3156464 RepID=UPI0033915829